MKQLKNIILTVIPRSFSKRVALLVAALAFFTMLINIVVIFFFEYSRYSKNVNYNIDSQFHIMSKDVSEAIITDDIYALYTMINDVYKNIDHIENIFILDRNGDYITDAKVLREMPDGNSKLYVIEEQLEAGSRNVGAIDFYINKKSILMEVLSKVGYLAILNAIIILFGAVAGIYLSKIVSQPIVRLHNQISQLNVLELPYKFTLPDYSSSETFRLKEIIENLSERLKESLEKISQQQQEMARSERLAYLGTMSAGLAHELKNPIMSINLILESMALETSSDPQFQEDYKMIKSQADKLVYRINEFLEYSKPVKIEKTKFSLFDLTSRIKQQSYLENLTDIDIKFDISLNASVFSDKEKLIQLCQIMLHNSIEAGATEAQIGMSLADDNLEIIYSDNGKGFIDVDVSKMLLPFYTTKKDGVGLGLAICKTILDALNGQIEIVTINSGGACFKICLPVLEA